MHVRLCVCMQLGMYNDQSTTSELVSRFDWRLGAARLMLAPLVLRMHLNVTRRTHLVVDMFSTRYLHLCVFVENH